MTEHDPFERELRAGLAAERAPDSLQRRIAQIPLEHLRPVRQPGNVVPLRRAPWLSSVNASWASGFAAAAASLAIGFWLGFAGMVGTDTSGNEDELVALVYSDAATTIGDGL